MTKTNQHLHSSLRRLSRAAFCTSVLLACQPEGSDPGDPDFEGAVGGSATQGTGGAVGAPAGGGGAPTGEAAGGSPGAQCDDSNAFQQAYVCAGSVYEERHVSQRSARLYPIMGSYACNTSGTDLTPFEDRPGGDGDLFGGDGDMVIPPGVGGAPAWGGDGDIFVGDGDGDMVIPPGVGGGPVSDGDGDDDGDLFIGDGDVAGSIPAGVGGVPVWGGDGDGAMGGEGPSAGGGEFGMGGAAGGGPTMGPGSMAEGWCSEAPEGVAIAGVTYSLNGCGDAEVKLPLVFQEPQNWYRLRVFHGDSACERGELVADTSGFGTGEIVELDVDGLAGGFLTLEFTADAEDYYDYYWDYDYYYYYGPYYSGDALHLELEPIGPNLGGQ